MVSSPPPLETVNFTSFEPSRWERLRRRLLWWWDFTVFDRSPEWPWAESDNPPDLATEVNLVLDLRDTLRVMLGGVITVRISIGRTISDEATTYDTEASHSITSSHKRATIREFEARQKKITRATRRLRGKV